MLYCVALDSFTEDAQVVLSGRLFGLLCVVSIFRDDNGSEDAENGYDDEDFNKGKAAKRLVNSE